MAASLPISLALTSIFKVAMFVTTAIILIMGLARGVRQPQLLRFGTPVLVLVMLGALALSLTYTSAPLANALLDFGKYGKLLVIPLVLVLVRTRREAVLALGAYIAAETFVILTSYILSLDVALFWVPKSRAVRLSLGTVYSSYIDQSIMTTGFAALCWHLRREFPGRHGSRIAVGLAILAAFNVMMLLPGRSGQVALLVALTLALYWALPGRGRPVAVLVPMMIIATAMAVSPDFRGRLSAVVSESQAYNRGDMSVTSSGLRLKFWQRSVQAIQEEPLTGYGLGSWHTEFTRLEGDKLNPAMARVRNPHQEYLLWGVQLGIGGIALLVAFMVVLVRDAMPFTPDIRRAVQSLVGIFAVVCLFNSTLFDALIGDYFCLLPALLLALGLHSAAPPRETAS
ncbi:MAG: O-antigen ligase family protein [Ramlibacter sp.]